LNGRAVTPVVVSGLASEFGKLHEQSYGYSSEREKVQIVAVKVLARGLPATPRVPERIVPANETRRGEVTRMAYFGPNNGTFTTPVLSRSSLTADPRSGPLIIEEYDSTTVVRPGWSARLDSANNIMMERMS